MPAAHSPQPDPCRQSDDKPITPPSILQAALDPDHYRMIVKCDYYYYDYVITVVHMSLTANLLGFVNRFINKAVANWLHAANSNDHYKNHFIRPLIYICIY